MERRDFLRRSLGASAIAAVPDARLLLPRHDAPTPPSAADDDAFWATVRRDFDPPTDYIDLDHANTAPAPRPVFDAWMQRARRFNRGPAEGFETLLLGDVEQSARPALATFLGTVPARVAFQPNATNALNTILHGFPLERGDEVLCTDHEYPDMVETLRLRARRDGITVTTVRVPDAKQPASLLADRVVAAIGPRTRLLLLSHVSAWNGEILPVANVAAAARARGVAVCVDAAQSVGLLDVRFDAWGADFLGASLHKGLGAPAPSGVLLMRPEWIGRVAPLHPPSWPTDEYPMEMYEWNGTYGVAAYATAGDAVAYVQRIGLERRRARLRALSLRWQSALRAMDGVTLLTPSSDDRWFGPAAFAVDAVPSHELAKWLRARRAVLVQDKAGRHSPFANAVRVSPAAHATFAEVDRLVEAVSEVAQRGRLPEP